MAVVLDSLESEVRFQQALHCAEVQCFASSITWRDFSLLAEHSQAFDLRIEQITTRKGVRVDLHSNANARLARLPFLKKLRKIRFGDTWFEIARCGDAVCAIAPTREGYLGIGKQFTLDVALLRDQHAELELIARANLFRLTGSGTERPSWFYHTPEELACCISEVEAFLTRIAAPLKAAFEAQFLGAADPLITELGNLSANEALSHAADFLSVDVRGLILDGFSAWPREEFYAAPPSTDMGRLKKNGMWRVFARELSLEKEAIVDVPFRGPVRGGWQSARFLSPGISKWMDSTDAACIFAQKTTTGVFNSTTLQLHGYDPIARWSAMVSGQYCNIDCHSGIPIK